MDRERVKSKISCTLNLFQLISLNDPFLDGNAYYDQAIVA